MRYRIYYNRDENKTAAVCWDCRPNIPAQVVQAPTQRTWVRTAGLVYPFLFPDARVSFPSGGQLRLFVNQTPCRLLPCTVFCFPISKTRCMKMKTCEKTTRVRSAYPPPNRPCNMKCNMQSAVEFLIPRLKAADIVPEAVTEQEVYHEFVLL